MSPMTSLMSAGSGLILARIASAMATMHASPGGKLGSAFQQAQRLPRRQQEKLAEFVRIFIAQHSDKAA